MTDQTSRYLLECVGVAKPDEISVRPLRARPKDSRFIYWFRPGDPPNPTATREEFVALGKTLEVDPWNPHRTRGSSLVELPGAPAQPWIQRTDGVPAGRVVERTMRSEILRSACTSPPRSIPPEARIPT